MWTKLFLEHQEYRVDKSIVFQYNKTSMLLEINNLKSAGKRSRAIYLRYFWMTDQIKKGSVVEQMTIIGMAVESEGSISGHQEAMVIFILLF